MLRCLVPLHGKALLALREPRRDARRLFLKWPVANGDDGIHPAARVIHGSSFISKEKKSRWNPLAAWGPPKLVVGSTLRGRSV